MFVHNIQMNDVKIQILNRKIKKKQMKLKLIWKVNWIESIERYATATEAEHIFANVNFITKISLTKSIWFSFFFQIATK